MPFVPRRHLPRLEHAAYAGRQFVHWTMTISERTQGWLTERFHAEFRVLLADLEMKYGVVVPVYCLMPDHLHCLATGKFDSADQLLWVRAVRRRVNVALRPLGLQKQAYDHVLRPAERGRDSFVALVHYISRNPVRAGLVERAEQWQYTGSLVSDRPKLSPVHPDFSEDWWGYWNGLCE